jgi:hypothetical protein
MSSEQGQQQLEKWRRQERFNQILIKSVLGGIVATALVLAGLLVFDLVKAVPTLTPAVLAREMTTRDGQVVRVRGRARPLDPGHIRVVDDHGISIWCEFSETIEEVKEGDFVKVEGKVSRFNGLVRCRLIED